MISSYFILFKFNSSLPQSTQESVYKMNAPILQNTHSNITTFLKLHQPPIHNLPVPPSPSQRHLPTPNHANQRHRIKPTHGNIKSIKVRAGTTGYRQKRPKQCPLPLHRFRPNKLQNHPIKHPRIRGVAVFGVDHGHASGDGSFIGCSWVTGETEGGC